MRPLYVLSSAFTLVVGFPTCHLLDDSGDCQTKLLPSRTLNTRLQPNHFTWLPPGPGDVRSPCPMLNTLANHGFLPHNGRGITLDMVKRAMMVGASIAEDISTAAFQPALKTNPFQNADFIDLDMLHVHNVIEHDGSLSRRDEYFDPTNPFDKATFGSFLSYFGNAQTLDVGSVANARARHALDMSKINPEFTITEETMPRILGENSLMLAVWGSPDKPVTKRPYFEYFFRNERFPVLLGWGPNDVPITVDAIQGIANQILAKSPPDVPLFFQPQAKR